MLIYSTTSKAATNVSENFTTSIQAAVIFAYVLTFVMVQFYEYLKKPVFDEVKEPMKILIEEIMRLEKFVEGALKVRMHV